MKWIGVCVRHIRWVSSIDFIEIKKTICINTLCTCTRTHTQVKWMRHNIHTELQFSLKLFSRARELSLCVCVCVRKVKMKMDVTIQLNSHSNDPLESVLYDLITLFSLFIDETGIIRTRSSTIDWIQKHFRFDLICFQLFSFRQWLTVYIKVDGHWKWDDKNKINFYFIHIGKRACNDHSSILSTHIHASVAVYTEWIGAIEMLLLYHNWNQSKKSTYAYTHTQCIKTKDASRNWTVQVIHA